MSNPKKNIQKKPAANAVKPKEQVQVKPSSMNSRDMNLALLAGVSIITFICFHYTLHNQFLNWDDWIYVTKDKYITSFSASNIYNMLFHDITLNYYHPLTMLTYAMNYQFSQLNPEGYYFTQIMLHILNAIIIFYFTKILMDSMIKVGYKAIRVIPWLVAVGSLIHGIHPMHVESVAWIAERKDVMYSIFYFLGLIMYVRYTEGAKFKWMLYLNIAFAMGCVWGIFGLKEFSLDFTLKSHNYSIWIPMIFIIFLVLLSGAILAEVKFKKIRIELFYVLEFFLLSLFSKPMAVSFPLSILAVDLLLKRDLTFMPKTGSWLVREAKALFKLGLEKWAFWVICFLSGLQSIILEIGHNTVVFTHGYSIIQKLLISSYAFTMYTVDAFFPANLCGYYPYPGLTSDHFLPSFYYVAPFCALAIIAVPLILTRKNKDLFRVALFSIGFYFANLVFILQFLSAGTTIMSDRYSYVSYFGLIFLLVYLAHWLWYKNKTYHVAIQGGLGLICATLGYMCYERTLVWHNPETFWGDIIVKSHETSQLPYLNLGDYLADSGKYDKAYVPYATLIRLHTDQAGVYRNMGNIYGMRKQIDSALYCFAMAIKYDSTDATIYNNLGVTYANLGKFDIALTNFRKAYKLDTTQDGVLVEVARTELQVGQLNEAVIHYGKLIQKQPKEPSNYMMRGNCFLNGGNPDAAIKDYLKVLELQPANGECMFNLSTAYDKLHREADALKYALLASQNKAPVPADYLTRLQRASR
ncbi:MAG TPA: tetratricopeptide repeat protein [Bacteroidia bacterium]|nr:tetratricopeptide repeat protein [Bacteroidia bacterium]